MNDFGMHDLLQKQINESCHLALPEGLQELMCDISREVLRSQPANVYSFITNYLAALLVTRENLAVASRVCTQVCESICHSGLKDDLMQIGLTEEEVEEVKETIEKYFAAGDVKEGNLLTKLMKKTAIDGEMLPAVQQSIRRAFLRYQAYNTTRYESSSDSDMDEATRAAHHTMKLYRHTKPNDSDMEKAATRIQTAYRAYGVRREKLLKKPAPKPNSKAIRFGNIESDQCSPTYSEIGSSSENNTPYYPPIEKTESYNSDVSKMVLHPSLQFKEQVLSVSSSSLAGSFIKLPKHVPYSAHEKDTLLEIDEFNEIEKEGTIDYTTLAETKSSKHKHRSNETTTKKAISFHSIHDLINNKIRLVVSDEEEYKRENIVCEEIDNGTEKINSVTNCVDSKHDINMVSEEVDKGEASDTKEATDEQTTDVDTDIDTDQESEIEDIADEHFEEDSTGNAIYFENEYMHDIAENNDDITGDMDRLIDDIDKDLQS